MLGFSPVYVGEHIRWLGVGSCSGQATEGTSLLTTTFEMGCMHRRRSVWELNKKPHRLLVPKCAQCSVEKGFPIATQIPCFQHGSKLTCEWLPDTDDISIWYLYTFSICQVGTIASCPICFKINQLDARPAEVIVYARLNDQSSRDYKDTERLGNSWPHQTKARSQRLCCNRSKIAWFSGCK